MYLGAIEASVFIIDAGTEYRRKKCIWYICGVARKLNRAGLYYYHCYHTVPCYYYCYYHCYYHYYYYYHCYYYYCYFTTTATITATTIIATLILLLLPLLLYYYSCPLPELTANGMISKIFRTYFSKCAPRYRMFRTRSAVTY